MIRICVFVKDSQLAPSACEVTVGDGCPWKNRFSPDTVSAATWISDFPPSRSVGSKFLWLSSCPLMVFSYSSPSRLRHRETWRSGLSETVVQHASLCPDWVTLLTIPVAAISLPLLTLCFCLYRSLHGCFHDFNWQILCILSSDSWDKGPDRWS